MRIGQAVRSKSCRIGERGLFFEGSRPVDSLLFFSSRRMQADGVVSMLQRCRNPLLQCRLRLDWCSGVKSTQMHDGVQKASRDALFGWLPAFAVPLSFA